MHEINTDSFPAGEGAKQAKSKELKLRRYCQKLIVSGMRPLMSILKGVIIAVGKSHGGHFFLQMKEQIRFHVCRREAHFLMPGVNVTRARRHDTTQIKWQTHVIGKTGGKGTESCDRFSLSPLLLFGERRWR